RGCRFVPARARRAERARRRSARPLAPARDALPGHGLRRARDRRDRCAKRLRARRSRFGVLGAEERRGAFARGVHAAAEDPPAREPVALVLADRGSADTRSGLEPALSPRPASAALRLPFRDARQVLDLPVLALVQHRVVALLAAVMTRRRPRVAGDGADAARGGIAPARRR